MQTKLQLLKELKELYHLKSIGFEYTKAREKLAPTISLSSANELNSAVLRCHLCELSKRRVCSMQGAGSGRSGVMIVVDQPSKLEDESGKWFRGKSGELLADMITKGFRLNLDDIYLTAAIKCNHLGKTPEKSVDACKNYLFSEIELVKPKVILSLGEVAFGMMTGSTKSVSGAREALWRVKNIPLVPSFLLGFLLANPSHKREAFADILKCKEIAKI